MYGHNRVGTIMSGQKRIWGQTYLATAMYCPNHVGTIISGHKHVYGYIYIYIIFYYYY